MALALRRRARLEPSIVLHLMHSTINASGAGSIALSASELSSTPEPAIPSGGDSFSCDGAIFEGNGVFDRWDSAHYEVRPSGLLERQDSANEVLPRL